MNIKEAINKVGNLIGYIEAKMLMQFTLNEEENYIVINANMILEKEYEQNYFRYVDEIIKGKPLQYITNRQEFMGESFFVNENVLIPQPDTEILVEQTINIANKLMQNIDKNFINKDKKNDNQIKILDLCTGSGAIAISLKKAIPDSYIEASDISKEALKIAEKNANNILKKENQIKFIQSDLLENINEKFDIIVSNPPYIKTNVIHTLSKDVQAEPFIALNGGEDGLNFYREIRNSIENNLNKNAYVLLEIGYDQKKEVEEIFIGAKCIKDYGENDRVIIWKGEHDI